MPYCHECGNKISATDKRCSKCGTLVDLDEPVDEDNKINDEVKISSSKYNNIEFALAIVAIVLSVFAVSQSIADFSYFDPIVIYFILFIILIGIIGAILIRYFAKPGAIILLIVGFMLVLSGIQNMILPIIFYVVVAIVAFVRN